MLNILFSTQFKIKEVIREFTVRGITYDRIKHIYISQPVSRGICSYDFRDAKTILFEIGPIVRHEVLISLLKII
jgi:hypothetical protein